MFVRIVMLVLCMMLCVLLVGGVYLFSENNSMKAEFKPESVKLDAGVMVQPAVVKSVFGEGVPVSVHVSPAGSETAGAKSVAADGTIHAWVPSTFVGSAASLTPAEVQEYVLRELKQCSEAECVFDTAGTPLDAGTLSEMAADQNIKRSGETSQMFATFLQADLAKYALDKQADVATHGMDKIAQVAVSGDTAQAAMAGFDAAGDSITAIAVIAVVGLFALAILKGVIGKGG
jgi:hypothetical protein